MAAAVSPPLRPTSASSFTSSSYARSPSPSSFRSPSPSSPRARASASPPVHHSSRPPRRSVEMNGAAAAAHHREGSISEDEEGVRRRHRSPRSPPNGVAVLPTIKAHEELDASALADDHAPPPAASTGLANGKVIRRRRSSSVKQKPPPGVTPQKVVDWEIPRKTFHSSIGLVALALNHLNPPSVKPLVQVLSIALVIITVVDLARLRYPAFAELWEVFCGFLMREEERGRINGVVWYLVGVITVLAAYPRDVAVVSILTLSWSDTTASTLGRLWGRYTPPLPAHFPGIKWLPFAPRKSLAGFLAASVTGLLIGLGFWWDGSYMGRWAIIDQGGLGFFLTAVVVGVGGAVVEALDLGYDDNLTLPILSGALIWLWLEVTNKLIALF